jgi:hypothetical protein
MPEHLTDENEARICWHPIAEIVSAHTAANITRLIVGGITFVDTSAKSATGGETENSSMPTCHNIHASIAANPIRSFSSLTTCAARRAEKSAG